MFEKPNQPQLTLQHLLKKYCITGRFIHIDRIRAFITENGKGFPFILIHGFGSSFYTWRYSINSLSKYYKVITVDLPKFGFTGKTDRNVYTISQYCAFLKQLFEKLNITNAHLMGHSLGGIICMEFSRKYKSLIKNIILVATPMPGKLTVPDKIISNLLLFSYCDKSIITSEIVNVFRLINDLNKATYKELSDITSSYKIVMQDLELSAPCLIIWGEEDLILPPNNAHKIQKLFKSAEIRFIPRCGHVPHEEKSDIFNNLILQYLK